MNSDASAPPRRPLALIAFGGNALAPAEGEGTQQEQRAHADALAEVLADLARDHRLLLVHGNGPQVGQLSIQVDAARGQVPPFSLDALVGASQGIIGYLLEVALREAFARHRLDREVVTALTLVRVDPDDPAFERPTKPVGPYYPTFAARELGAQRGWEMVRQDARGWRRLVPSPRPLEVFGVGALADLLEDDRVVIAGGGGGIPIARRDDGRIEGVEAVVDKDRTAALLARALPVERFVVLTAVDRVETSFGTPDAEPIDRMTVRRARELLARGEFPPGSMGPKVEACLDVVEATGEPALITSVRCLGDALRGRGGTWIVPLRTAETPR